MSKSTTKSAPVVFTSGTAIATTLFSQEALETLQESMTSLVAKAEKYRQANPGKACCVTKDAVLLQSLNDLGVEIPEDECSEVMETIRELAGILHKLGAFPGMKLVVGQWGGFQREGYVAPDPAKKGEGEKAAKQRVNPAERLRLLQALEG